MADNQGVPDRGDETDCGQGGLSQEVFRPARTRIPKRRKGPPRRGPIRDKKHLARVSKLPCCICRPTLIQELVLVDWVKLVDRPGMPRRSDPMHGPVNGMGSKGPDSEVVPGCRIHHDQLDGRTKLPNGEVGRRAFEAYYRVDLGDIGRRIWESAQGGD